MELHLLFSYFQMGQNIIFDIYSQLSLQLGLLSYTQSSKCAIGYQSSKMRPLLSNTSNALSIWNGSKYRKRSCLCTELGIEAWGLVTFSEQVAFSWLSVDRFWKILGGLRSSSKYTKFLLIWSTESWETQLLKEKNTNPHAPIPKPAHKRDTLNLRSHFWSNTHPSPCDRHWLRSRDGLCRSVWGRATEREIKGVTSTVGVAWCGRIAEFHSSELSQFCDSSLTSWLT